MNDSTPLDTIKKPSWLKRRLPAGHAFETTRHLIRKAGLHTVCQEAKCPNLWECFSRHTATFLILGDRCTRNCGFCAVASGRPLPPDGDEPARVAQAAELMGLQYVVITSVTRDDLPDGGASLFAQTVREIRHRLPNSGIEVLIPDFQGDRVALDMVIRSGADVINHNLETVPRLYPEVRPQAIYRRSLELLKRVSETDHPVMSKSGMMLGLGETEDEIYRTFDDLLNVGCRILTLGQYLQPTKAHLPVVRFVAPQDFEQFRLNALEMGFRKVASGPFVRSSYHARELFQAS
jgi:lipoic acid synthetase